MSSIAVEQPKVTPGVVLKTKFVLPNNKTFQSYIDYVDRDEAQRNNTYGQYSTHSVDYGEKQKNKQKYNLNEKQKYIVQMKQKAEKEKNRVEQIQQKSDNYNKYIDFMGDRDSVEKLFSYENPCFSWREKKELKNLFKDYTKNVDDFATEDKAIEKFSRYVEKFVSEKKEKLQSTIDKKENYIGKLESRIKNETEKVKEMYERIQNFDKYTDYMDNPEKTSSLFTANSNKLNEQEKKALKEMYKTAHDNGSVMWQDVISFDNKWLQEQGVYAPKTHKVDEKKLMDVTRVAMKEMQKRERLEKTSIWSAAIHYNTDNIHIHVATVEPYPTRERGKRRPKTLDAMKGKVVNNILDRKEELKKINDLIRNNMVGNKREDSTLRWRNRNLKPLFLHIYKNLPDDKKQWQYSYNTIKHLRPHIDELSKQYIEKYHKKDYNDFLKKLDKEVDVMKKAYGEGSGDKKRYENYKQNKIDDLYKRMGNAFLQEMKSYAKEQEKIERMNKPKAYKTFHKNVSLEYTVRKMGKAFRSEYETWKNIKEYEKMQRQIEYENERG